MTSNTLHPVSTRKGGLGLERGGRGLSLLPCDFRDCGLLRLLSHPSSDSPTPAWLPGGCPGGAQCHQSIHPQRGLHPNHRILEPRNGGDPKDHLIPPFTRPSCKIVLVWPPCSALCQPLNRWENLQFELHLASSGAKTHRTGFSWPQAKPASSLRHSENRVHWKSAKLQYIGISICQLLNSKTDCLKTESVSYSKFTLNSSPFLHL